LHKLSIEFITVFQLRTCSPFCSDRRANRIKHLGGGERRVHAADNKTAPSTDAENAWMTVYLNLRSSWADGTA
jgi:hypothetical protein